MKSVTVLGATGSIGTSTLDVLARHRGDYRVIALTAHRDHERLAEQCRVHQPRYAVMEDADAAACLRARLASVAPDVEVLSGAEALAEVAALPEADCVMAAIVGAAGLRPTLAAVRAGKRVLLANKEALVMSGRLFMDEVRACGAQLLPVDSEHNAVFQCLPPGNHSGLAAAGVRRIWLTASGGPFRTLDPALLAQVTPEQACAHPNWVMGRKISVDSATMMNKGLEVIEACWLFGATAQEVEVVIHPQSVIHSLVEYADGSLLAQLGSPDMRTPIACALSWPERIDSGVQRLDLFEVARLDFERPEPARFPCLRLAYEAFAHAGTATAVLNAANEVAVQAFLDRQLAYDGIPAVIEETLGRIAGHEADSLQIIFDDDARARECAAELVAQRRRRG